MDGEIVGIIPYLQRKIRVDIGEKTGLHCSENPTMEAKPICDALDRLDKDVVKDQKELDKEKELVGEEIGKGTKYVCNCTYQDWKDNWGDCSATCGDGIQKETADIQFKARNGGAQCLPSDGIRTKKCNLQCCSKYHSNLSCPNIDIK